MICDKCRHRDVCMYREKCQMLESSIQESRIDDIITLSVNCKKKDEYNGIKIPHEASIEIKNDLFGKRDI